MLSERTIELGPVKKMFLPYPFVIYKRIEEDWMSCFIMNLKLLNQFITCTKFKMNTEQQIREVIHLGYWAILLDIKSATATNPQKGGTTVFSCFKWKEKHHIILQDTILWLINSVKDLHKGYETHLSSLSGDRNNCFCIWQCTHPDRILQAGQDRWRERVASFLQKFGFVLGHNKCQFEPTQMFTHLGLIFNTREMTILLPGKRCKQFRLK